MQRDFDYRSEKILIVGKSGCGKSTLLEYLLRSLPFRHKFIFDHKGQFARAFPGAFVARSQKELLAAVFQTGSVIFDPSRMFPGTKIEDGKEIPFGATEGFRWFCKIVFQIGQKISGEKVLVFDEAGLLLPNHTAVYNAHPIRWFAETGREWRWNLICAAQKAGQINNELLLQFTKVFAFQTTNKRAAQTLIDSLDFDYERLCKLRQGEWICYDDTKGEFIPPTGAGNIRK